MRCTNSWPVRTWRPNTEPSWPRSSRPSRDGTLSLQVKPIALLRHPSGRQEEIAASCLISADGIQGTTGNLLKLPARGKPEAPSYVLAVLRLDGDLRDNAISVFLGHRGFVMLLPIGGGQFQCIATGPSARSGEGSSQAELRQFIDGCLPASVRLRQVRWSSRFPDTGRLSPELLRRGLRLCLFPGFGGGCELRYPGHDQPGLEARDGPAGEGGT